MKIRTIDEKNALNNYVFQFSRIQKLLQKKIYFRNFPSSLNL